MKKINKFLKIRRKRSKPIDQKYYKANNIVIILGVIALVGFIILAVILNF
ncbi:hypothetical protein [uncultured Tenacibaculum sp.]|nr:hypothetical protein [uncultured Tenacibaculum sp.]